MGRKRIFISVANREHEDLRAQLRDVLIRTTFFDVEVQPDFPHTATETVRKLDDRIAPCDLLIHIVGRDPGSRANDEAVADFFRHTEPMSTCSAPCCFATRPPSAKPAGSLRNTATAAAVRNSRMPKPQLRGGEAVPPGAPAHV